MLAEEQGNRWNQVSERGFVILDEPAEILKVELRHHYQSVTAVDGSVDHQI